MNKNKCILNKFSETSINISKENNEKLIEIFKMIGKIETIVETSNFNFKSSIFTNALLEKEGIDSSIIEGTQTNHDEMFFDIEGINNVFSWETRNIINLYKETFIRLSLKTFRYSTDNLSLMHEKMYESKLSSKWKNTFDPKLIISKIKPGKIIEDDKNPNWIGRQGIGKDKATLIPIKPSLKREYLDDLFIALEHGPKSYENIIKFHPIFEGIHPFADGNGRLGRVLLTSYFKKVGYTKNNWLFLSDYWKDNKDEYIAKMHHVQTTCEWDVWTTFFMDSLMAVTKKRCNQVEDILKLYNSILFSHGKPFNGLEELIIRSFFKFPKLRKSSTIAWLKEKNYAQPTIYRTFDKISKLVKAKNENGYHVFYDLLKIVRK